MPPVPACGSNPSARQFTKRSVNFRASPAGGDSSQRAGNSDMPIRLPLTFALLSVLAILSLVGCGKSVGSVRAAAPPPAPVSVVEVQPRAVPIFADYAAQTFARDGVEIRGQVDGYIRRRLFRTGADVKAGEVLYI